MNSNGKLTFLLLAVIVLYAPGAFAQGVIGGQDYPLVSDCKDDMDCFIRAAQSCQSARMSGTSSASIFGVTITAHGAIVIKGGSVNACTVYMRTEKVDARIDDAKARQLIANGMTPQELGEKQLEARQMAKKEQGVDGTCVFKAEVYVSLLKKWKEGSSSSHDWNLGKCEGRMFQESKYRIKVRFPWLPKS